MSEPRAEPRGCTMGDLIALTLGAAIAMSLHWYSNETNSVTLAGKLAPGWYVIGKNLVELAQKCCVALIPVILYRRWLHGGPLRPIAYLPILTGLSQIAWSTARLPIFGMYYWADGPRRLLINMEVYETWIMVQLAIGLLASLLVWSVRKRASAWVTGFLIAIAWNRLSESLESFYRPFANDWIMSMGWPVRTVGLVSTVLVNWPMNTIFYLPLFVLLIDLRHRIPRRWTWVDWVALTLGLSLPILYEARYFAGQVVERELFAFRQILQYGSLTAAFFASYLIARFSEPAWRRLLGLEPVDSLAASEHSQEAT